LDDRRLLEIYGQHKKELFIYLFRLCRSRETAEDLLQDCFVNLIRYSRKYDLKDINIRSFLYKTAHNLCVNSLKRANFLRQVPVEEDSGISGDDTVSRDFDYEELSGKIDSLLRQVDVTSRSIFIMRKELEMDPASIAKTLKVSERTVRRKIARVLEFLAENLRKTGFMSIIFLFSGLLAMTACLIIERYIRI